MNNLPVDRILKVRAIERKKAVWQDACVMKWRNSGLLEGLSWGGTQKMACLLEQAEDFHKPEAAFNTSAFYQPYIPFVVRDVFKSIVEFPWVQVIQTPHAVVVDDTETGEREVTVAFRRLLSESIPNPMLHDTVKTLGFLVRPLNNVILGMTCDPRKRVYFNQPLMISVRRPVDPSTFQPLEFGAYTVTVHTRQATVSV